MRATEEVSPEVTRVRTTATSSIFHGCWDAMKEEYDNDTDNEHERVERGQGLAQKGTSRPGLTILNASQASAQRYPPGCPVVYGLRPSPTSRRFDCYQATVKHIFIDVMSRTFFYEVVERAGYCVPGSNSALDLEQQVGKMVREDELAYAINCPVRVKGLIDNDPDKRWPGRIVCPEKAKNDSDMTYDVQFLIGNKGFLRVQKGVPSADIEYDDGDEAAKSRYTRVAATNDIKESPGKKTPPEAIKAIDEPSEETSGMAQGVSNSTASLDKFDTIKSRRRKGTSGDDAASRGETSKKKKRKAEKEKKAASIAQKIPRRRGSGNRNDGPGGAEESAKDEIRNIDTDPIPLSDLKPGVKVLIASGKMSDKDWLFYATIISVKEPTNKRKNLQIRARYEGYRGSCANAVVQHKSIIYVLPPHKDITELERPKLAMSYQAENIAPFTRAEDYEYSDKGILGPVHCTFTMWGRRNALVEWEGLSSPMDFTIAEIERESESGVIKLKEGTNKI